MKNNQSKPLLKSAARWSQVRLVEEPHSLHRHLVRPALVVPLVRILPPQAGQSGMFMLPKPSRHIQIGLTPTDTRASIVKNAHKMATPESPHHHIRTRPTPTSTKPQTTKTPHKMAYTPISAILVQNPCVSFQEDSWSIVFTSQRSVASCSRYLMAQAPQDRTAQQHALCLEFCLLPEQQRNFI